MTVTWSWKPFEALALEELYAVLALRADVFVVEQACAFQDLDGRDPDAQHLLGVDGGGQLVAYLRAFAPTAMRATAEIGRVVTASSLRGTGLGRELFERGVRQVGEWWPQASIDIGAQARLERFYQGFGFRRSSAPYLEDGIVHIKMTRDVPSPG